jgi:hypothetical protein
MLNTENIEQLISAIPFVDKVYSIEKNDSIIMGKVGLFFNGLDKILDFNFEIYPQYPLKYHDSESIRFLNQEFIEINHVMEDGSICIHNSHNLNLKQKLLIDFGSLKQWIEKYYINKESDTKYEHIIVNESLINDEYYSYIFTDVDYKFQKGNFGIVHLSSISNTIFKNKSIHNFLVKNFELNKAHINCKWSDFYQSFKSEERGLFYFIDEHPAKYNKFIFEDWKDFDGLISKEFLNVLYNFENKRLKKHAGTKLPLFFGYKTINDEIHWQVALITIGEFPIKGEAEVLLGVKTGRWDTKLINQNIQWTLTRDSSYKYFFGRGVLDKFITHKKILIIGVGAIGSMIAKTLTKSGCKYIDIVDYDIKEPENVCRSEYTFQYGLSDKVLELQQILASISPFVEIGLLADEFFESITKIIYQNINDKTFLTSILNNYDIVFDCSTDNDLMSILSSLDLTCDLLNMSITNHAQELVCAFSPNIYHFVSTQFENILDNDLDDLYEPTGCWNPTFKASYNDINMLIQFSIKHINNLYRDKKQKNNFVVQMSNDSLKLEIKEY